MPPIPQSFGARFLLRQTPCRCRPTTPSTPTSSHLFIRIRFLQTRPAGRPSAALPPKPRAALNRGNASSTTTPTKNITLAPRSPVLENRALKTYVDQLASRGRTLLYEAPSHFWYRFSSFAAGAFCISYTTYQYFEVIAHPREGLAWWVPHAFAVICMFMAGMGTYFVLGTSRLVRSIEVVPTRLLTRTLSRKAQKSSSIYIEITTARPIPFLPPKKTLYLPQEVQLPFRMQGVLSKFGGQQQSAPQKKSLSMAEQVRAERAAREAKAKAAQYTRDHILTTPFRDAVSGFRQVWAGIRRPFYREGFAKLQLKDGDYKLDVTGGWTLDDGRAMDRLFAARPGGRGPKI
ncbi:hypothetical protein B0H66DRAFT_601948 [Apodospora peruviana]|uniref:Uncharacterized protein n=1 Tax=Apodospora peruviana TaxID=516989 RepID=A0AAE0M7N3_9PEZI|nr:hypothetical protein B0H66DRAFT_601948 [Apodospora peruviana]